MELPKKEKNIISFIFLTLILASGLCQNVSRTYDPAVTNCGVIIRPDPDPFEDTLLESGDWPWLATIYKAKLWGLEKSCVGTLISSRAVLTTASCLYTFEKSIKLDEIVVRLGQANLGNWNERSAVSLAISNVTVHPNDQQYGERDIAIIELKDNIVVTDFVKPACLWTGDSATSEGNFGYEAVWRNNAAYRTSSQLVNSESCFRLTNNEEDFDDYDDDITFETTFCAGKKNSVGACSTNTGAGLMFKQNGRWAVRGILVRECKLEYKLYVDVAKVYDWIQVNLPKLNVTSGILESAAEVCGQSNFAESILLQNPVSEIALVDGEWPWMASIIISAGGSLRKECLGILISSRSILTSVSCALKIQPNFVAQSQGVFVRLGQTNIAEPNPITVITSSIQYFETSPEQILNSAGDTISDVGIAIVVLTEQISFTRYVQPACLFSTNIDSNLGEYGFMGQWSSTTDKSGTLIAPKILNETACLKDISNRTQETSFCAGEASPGACINLATGPGVLVKLDNKWTIRGIANYIFGNRCRFFICADVASFIDWIKSVHSNIKEFGSPSLTLSSTRSDDTCGQVSPNFNFTYLAFGGNEIQRGSWPWLVAIYKIRRNTPTYHCGGTLISNKLILTAAHCFSDRNGELTRNDIRLYLGLYELHKTDAPGVISPSVQDISVHNEFPARTKSSDADIALITLTEPVIFTKFIQPACVWAAPDSSYNQIGSVVGWGRFEEADLAERPRQVYVRIVDGEECLRSHDAFTQIASKRSFCAGNKDNSGPCQGDSGSGLVVENKGRLYLRGIVSTSLRHPSLACDLSQYVVYSDVSQYIEWIREVTTNSTS